MILRRIGNKSLISKDLISYFPEHNIYIEPFFGAGGIFFNKPKVKYNIFNDLDSDVFNLFMVVINHKSELEDLFYKMPIHSDLLNYWRKNKEIDPIKKALRFLFLSNFTLFGKQDTIQGGTGNTKENFYNVIDKTYRMINDVKFFNTDFEVFLNKKIAFGESAPINDCFIYADPPYIDTVETYSDQKNKWSSSNFIRLIDSLEKTKCRYAISELYNDWVVKYSKNRGLNIIEIREKRMLTRKTTSLEILIINYNNELNPMY